MKDDEESDDSLIARAGRGDRLAASVLISRHSVRVYSVCRSFLGNKSAAEDAAQEVFLKLWEGAARWRPNGARLETWLYRVAANACMDRHRAARRFMPEDAAGERIDDAPSPESRLSGEDRRRLVEDALSRLPDNQRIAMTLRHYQEMTNIEIAETMTMSVDAVESLLARARRGLRTALAAQRVELMESAE